MCHDYQNTCILFCRLQSSKHYKGGTRPKKSGMCCDEQLTLLSPNLALFFAIFNFCAKKVTKIPEKLVSQIDSQICP